MNYERSLLLVGVGLLSTATFAQEKIPPPMKPEATEFYTTIPPKITPGNSKIIFPPRMRLFFWRLKPECFCKCKRNGSSPASGNRRWSIHCAKEEKGDIQSKLAFGDAQYHLEWNCAYWNYRKKVRERKFRIFPNGNLWKCRFWIAM